MPDDVREQAERELGRLERMGDASGEASMIRTYLDWLLAVPWGKRSEERLDPVNARGCSTPTTLGSKTSRTGSSSTSRFASSARSAVSPRTKRSGAILTLIGLGTGKTSVEESIARALNREFVRMSLGGVHDEAEIRGHRRTYIGACRGGSCVRFGTPRR